MGNPVESSTVTEVTVSAEIRSQLYLAYLGLSPQRQDAVDERVKASKGTLSKPQAIFEEIFMPRLEIYTKRGQEKQEERVSVALEILVARGTPRPEARRMLGLGEVAE